MNQLKAWMRAATPEEQEDLAKRAGTSRQYLYQLSNGHRSCGVELGAEIETVTRIMNKETRGVLPVVYRTDLVQACYRCDYAHRCLGLKAHAAPIPTLTDEIDNTLD